ARRPPPADRAGDGAGDGPQGAAARPRGGAGAVARAPVHGAGRAAPAGELPRPVAPARGAGAGGRGAVGGRPRGCSRPPRDLFSCRLAPTSMPQSSSAERSALLALLFSLHAAHADLA